jgi:hypothetical protein
VHSTVEGQSRQRIDAVRYATSSVERDEMTLPLGTKLYARVREAGLTRRHGRAAVQPMGGLR